MSLDFGDAIYDGDGVIINGEWYTALFVEEEFNEAYQSDSVRVVFVKDK